MKIRFLTLLLFVTCFVPSLTAQVDSTLIDGKYYKIYPIRHRIEIPNEYWIAVDDEAYFQDEENYFKVFGEREFFNRADFDTASALVKGWLYEDLESRWKWLTKKEPGFRGRFIKAVRENPAAIVSPNYQTDVDILPAFSSLPDGPYVQLFNDFCLVGEKGICEEQTRRVAVYFNLKNNLLHGPATWVDLNGDTLRSGSFSDGMRNGTWRFTKIQNDRRTFNKWEGKWFARNGGRLCDTSYIIKTYSKGELDGPYSYYSPKYKRRITGYYTNGEESGHWQNFKKGVLVKNYTYAGVDDTLITHKPLLRTYEPLRDSYDYEKFNTHSNDYERLNAPTDLVEFDFGNEDLLELDEEEFQSHELEYEVDYYDSYRFEQDYLGFPERIYDRVGTRYLGGGSSLGLYELVYDPNREFTETRGYFLDSLGGRMRYTGPYELYYPNGQLFVRYNFENGELLKEDTMFWDNGQAWDVIEFVPDSNHYLRKVYDYNGALMNTAIYDSLGDFLKYDVQIEEFEDYITIDGVRADKEFHNYSGSRGFFGRLSPRINRRLSEYYNGNYEYKNTISLDSIIPDTALSFKREYSGIDKKTLVEHSAFNPQTRTYTLTKNSITGVNYLNIERTYTENYNSWNGKTVWKYGKFTVIETASGIYWEDPSGMDTDSVIRVRRVRRPYSEYRVTTDIEILKDGVPYTGKVRLKRRKFFNRQSKNKLVLRSDFRRSNNELKRRLYRYARRGKKGYDLLDLISSPAELTYTNSHVKNYLFQTAGNQWFAAHTERGGYYRGSDIPPKTVKGQFVEGKAQGYWSGKRKGKLTGDIQFERGEAFGTHRQFGFEPKASKYQRSRSEDSLPSKKTYYLNATTEYENGLRNGLHRDYSWYGGIEVDGTFENGFEEGVFINRFPKAYTKAQYKNGYLDGYAQTYLTFPDMDTVLLFDLNFKNGTLNGESNAYHINGELAKRGFFLNGEPIEDYEAYDTLGFRYHYVKFKYGFPIEEKIWEENQLSLRYRFDWQDSIEFDPSDLMQSQSLERFLSRYGYNDYELQQAYYGRNRLVNKIGLNYHMTKFYPNDTIARVGRIDNGKKIGHWDFYDYDGVYLYKVNYFDTVIKLNDSIRFKSKGILTKYNAAGDSTYKAHIIEKMEKYDCAHTDHYEIRQLYTVWQASDTLGRMNGYVRNYYDNGVLQNEGQMKDGLPTGLWKYYDPFGKLNLMGSFVQGKRDGRWLSGDLEKKKYLGEICLNPNLPDLEAEKKYRENLIDVTIITYRLGKTVSKQFFDLNLNKYSDLIEE